MLSSFSPEEKIKEVFEYKSGKESQEKITKKYGMKLTTIYQIIRFFRRKYILDKKKGYSV